MKVSFLVAYIQDYCAVLSAEGCAHGFSAGHVTGFWHVRLQAYKRAVNSADVLALSGKALAHKERSKAAGRAAVSTVPCCILPSKMEVCYARVLPAVLLQQSGYLTMLGLVWQGDVLAGCQPSQSYGPCNPGECEHYQGNRAVPCV